MGSVPLSILLPTRLLCSKRASVFAASMDW
jgi:hypothetical protein